MLLVETSGIVPSVDEPVTWSGIDTLAHTASAIGCFSVGFAGERSASVAFDARADGLYAAEEGGLLARCTGAQALPDGSYRLDYKCLLHPQMIGVLVIH